MPHGAAPGERRGGRAKGTPNKKQLTVESALVLLSRKAHGPLANFMLARRGCDLVGVKIPTF
jgi:hypothetical protein